MFRAIKAPLTILFVLALTLTFAMPTSASPNSDANEQAEAKAAIQQLESSTDKTKAFQAMSPKLKAAVLKALKVARVEKTDRSLNYGVKLGNASVPAAIGCSGRTVSWNARNWYGYLLWRYSQTLYWCYNTDSNQVFGLSHYKSVVVNCCWWSFNGTVGDYHQGGENQSYYYAWAQGAFTYSAPFLGAVQSAYPQVWQTVTGSGGYSSGARG